MYFNAERAKRLMEEQSLDALVTTAPVNVSYFTGFPLPHGCMADVQAWAIVPFASEIRPVLVAPVNAIDMVLDFCYVEDVRTWGTFFFYEAPDVDWSTAPKEERDLRAILDRETVAGDAWSAVRKTLQDLGLSDARIGLDEREMIVPSSLEQFADGMPKARVSPARHLISLIRAVKTDDEVRKLRNSARINEMGVQALLDFGRAGVTEKELHQVYLKTIRDAGAESHHACIQAGRRAALPAGEPGPAVLRPGQSVRLDFDLVMDRYFADMARTATVGAPDEQARRFAKSTLAGLERCKEVMRPGIRASEVFHEAIRAARENGIPDFDRHHVGHGIGLACYDYPLLSPKNDMLLEQNMVINIEAPYYLLGFGASHFEDTMLITSDGAECLQSMSMDLKELPSR